MHHTRTRAGEATCLSQGSVRHYAGMLAEGTSAEVERQRHPENSLCLGQSHTCLPGYPGLVFLGNMCGCLSASIHRRNKQHGIYPKQHCQTPITLGWTQVPATPFDTLDNSL